MTRDEAIKWVYRIRHAIPEPGKLGLIPQRYASEETVIAVLREIVDAWNEKGSAQP